MRGFVPFPVPGQQLSTRPYVNPRFGYAPLRNLGTQKTSKMSHFPINGTSTTDEEYKGTQGRSLRPGISFGVCSRCLANHIRLLVFNLDSWFHIAWPYPYS